MNTIPRNKTTKERGYGSDHQRQRQQWKPLVDAGQVMCHAKLCMMTHRLILPGTPWDLGHNDTRTQWTGPEHRRCNRADGGRRRSRGQSARTRWTL